MSYQIKDLLDLKQQQASIIQAFQSVTQADETVNQGRSILVFTVVSIIFVSDRRFTPRTALVFPFPTFKL